MGGGPSRPCNATNFLAGNPSDECTTCLSDKSLDASLRKCFGVDTPEFYSNLLAAAHVAKVNYAPNSLNEQQAAAAFKKAFAPAVVCPKNTPPPATDKSWIKSDRTTMIRPNIIKQAGETQDAFDKRCIKACADNPDCLYFNTTFRTGGQCTLYKAKTEDPNRGFPLGYSMKKPELQAQDNKQDKKQDNKQDNKPPAAQDSKPSEDQLLQPPSDNVSPSPLKGYIRAKRTSILNWMYKKSNEDHAAFERRCLDFCDKNNSCVKIDFDQKECHFRRVYSSAKDYFMLKPGKTAVIEGKYIQSQPTALADYKLGVKREQTESTAAFEKRCTTMCDEQADCVDVYFNVIDGNDHCTPRKIDQKKMVLGNYTLRKGKNRT